MTFFSLIIIRNDPRPNITIYEPNPHSAHILHHQPPNSPNTIRPHHKSLFYHRYPLVCLPVAHTFRLERRTRRSRFSSLLCLFSAFPIDIGDREENFIKSAIGYLTGRELSLWPRPTLSVLRAWVFRNRLWFVCII